MTKETLAIIPARAGSERLPQKNVLPLNGKPLLTYAIEQAKASQSITRIVVATEDAEIESIARASDTGVIKIPAQLAEGDVKEVIQWVLYQLEKYEAYKPLLVVLLQPTSPLRSTENIDNCVKIVETNIGDSLTTINEETGKENGAVYVFSRYLGINAQIYGANLYRYKMPADRSVDIDTQEDFDQAEAYLKEGEKDDNSRMLYKLARPERSTRNDKGSKRGRPRKSR